MKDKARTHKPKNIGNNNSVAQETSIEDVSTETVQTSELEISYDTALQIIPSKLYNHMAWMITNASEQVDKNGRVKLSEKEKKQVLNVAQDLMSQVTTLPMPKHVGLALHIHKQTRSKELIRMMSKFGHSVSYDDTQRFINSFSHQVDQQTLQTGFLYHRTLYKGNFFIVL